MKKMFAVPHFSNPEIQRRANILVTTQVAAVVMMVLIGTATILSGQAGEHPEVVLESIVGVVAMILSYYYLKMENWKSRDGSL